MEGFSSYGIPRNNVELTVAVSTGSDNSNRTKRTQSVVRKLSLHRVLYSFIHPAQGVVFTDPTQGVVFTNPTRGVVFTDPTQGVVFIHSSCTGCCIH